MLQGVRGAQLVDGRRAHPGAHRVKRL
jgi:hypothetical protein